MMLLRSQLFPSSAILFLVGILATAGFGCGPSDEQAGVMTTSAASREFRGARIGSEPVVETSPEPVANISPEPVANISPEPVANISSEPAEGLGSTANEPGNRALEEEAEEVSESSLLSEPQDLADSIVDDEGEGPKTISFELLTSFEYDMEDELSKKEDAEESASVDKIPPHIKGLDQKLVSLEGYMMPLKVEKGKVTELLLLRDQSACCYGAVPKITEWVSVTMADGGVEPVMDEPVKFHGTLKVGEVRENGYLVGIYEMEGDKMIAPIGL